MDNQKNLFSKSNQNDSSELRKDRLKFCATQLSDATAAMEMLEAITPRSWTQEKDRSLFIARLMNYPMWKLMKVDEYAGRIDGGVFKFLEDIKAPPDNARESLGYEYKLPEPKSSYGKAVLEHIKKLTSLETKKEMREFEMASLKKLNEDYPGRGLDAVIRSRQSDYDKLSFEVPLVR